MDLCKIFDLLARPANDSSSASRRLGHFGIINNTRILSFPPPPPAFVRVSKKTEPAARPAFVSPERVFPLVFLFLFFFVARLLPFALPSSSRLKMITRLDFKLDDGFVKRTVTCWQMQPNSLRRFRQVERIWERRHGYVIRQISFV